jgi:hypothetical protein
LERRLLQTVSTTRKWYWPAVKTDENSKSIVVTTRINFVVDVCVHSIAESKASITVVPVLIAINVCNAVTVDFQLCIYLTYTATKRGIMLLMNALVFLKCSSQPTDRMYFITRLWVYRKQYRSHLPSTPTHYSPLPNGKLELSNFFAFCMIIVLLIFAVLSFKCMHDCFIVIYMYVKLHYKHWVAFYFKYT